MANDIVTETMDKVTINNLMVHIRSVDRSMKSIKDWWEALQQAESVHFPNRSALYDILATVEIDGTLTGIINKRIMNVTNKNICFKKDNKKVDRLDELVKTEAFKNLRWDRFAEVTHGLVGFEFIPGAEFQYKLIPNKHINPVLKRITKDEWGTDGLPYEGVWNLLIRGDRFNFGILTKCAPYALWKKGDMGDWAQYIEVFGQPFLFFTYDAHDEKTKLALDEMMRNMGGGTKMTIPKQVEPNMQDGKQNNGDGQLQNIFRQACNEEMKLIVLGVTETSGSSQSSGYAQAKVHGEQQDEVTKDDMDDELHFFNSKQFLAIQKSYGYPADGEWCYEEEIDLEKVKKQVDILMTVSKRQPVDDDYVYEITGIPKPKNYDALKTQMEEERQAIVQSKQQQPQSGKPPNKKKAMSAGRQENLSANEQYKKGDRVTALVSHMPGMKGMSGEINIVEDGPYYGIKFDGEKETHKWYAQDELKPADDKMSMTAKPVYKKGDRVTTKVGHMPGMKGMSGEINIVEDGPYYAIQFDGEKEIHKWYAHNEIELEVEEGDNNEMKMSAWNKIRSMLADFFAPAPTE